MVDASEEIRDLKNKLEEFKTNFSNFEKKLEAYQQFMILFNTSISITDSAKNTRADFVAFGSLIIALISMAVTGFLSNSLSSTTTKYIIIFGIASVIVVFYINFKDYLYYREQGKKILEFLELMETGKIK